MATRMEGGKATAAAPREAEGAAAGGLLLGVEAAGAEAVAVETADDDRAT
jgi:hypothetical protein